MALYHSERPQTFADVIGQKHIVTTLQNQIRSGKVAHAYLFFGPRGVGKTTTARIVAKALNCTKPDKKTLEPCDTCDMCISIRNGYALDVLEIDAASHTGVDNVRENIIENARFKPSIAAKKVFIIDEVHMLSTSAFNALLKILEEPPSYIHFILATTEIHKLPETVISRCQRFTFGRISADILSSYIISLAKSKKVTLDVDVIERIVSLSEGCVRDAVNLLEQLMASGSDHITAQTALLFLPIATTNEAWTFLEALAERDPKAAFRVIADMYSSGDVVRQFMDECLNILRHALVLSSGAQASNMSFEDETRLRTLFTHMNNTEIIQLIDLFFNRRTYIHTSPIAQLPLELIAADWCGDTIHISQTTKEPAAKSGKDMSPPLQTISIQKTAKKMAVKSAEESAAEQTDSANVPVTLTSILEKWPLFLEIVAKDSPAMVIMLRQAIPIEVKKDNVTLGVVSDFYKKALSEPQGRIRLEDRFSTMMEKKITFNIMIDTRAQESALERKNDIQKLAGAFGGEVMH